MGDEQNFPAYRVLSTRAIVWAAIGLMVVGVGLAAWLLLAYGGGTDADKARLEAIKTAGTIVVGTGGAAALWLAARRQQTSEIALRQKDKDQAHQERVAAHTKAVTAAAQAHQERVALQSEHDAAERRVTDLYTKAVEQLGSEKAPVRLGGMYALERLAQNVPGQRQTIVNVLCAYLRMPYLPPALRSSTGNDVATPVPPPNASRNVETEPSGKTDQAEDERRHQERQVRLTAQRILSDHLCPNGDDGFPNEKFWSNIDLELIGATLLDFPLNGCHIRIGRFHGAFDPLARRSSRTSISRWTRRYQLSAKRRQMDSQALRAAQRHSLAVGPASRHCVVSGVDVEAPWMAVRAGTDPRALRLLPCPPRRDDHERTRLHFKPWQDRYPRGAKPMSVVGNVITAAVALLGVVLGGWLTLCNQDRSWHREHAQQWRDIRLAAYNEFISAYRQYVAFALEPTAKITAVPHPRATGEMMPFFDEAGRPLQREARVRLHRRPTRVGAARYR